MSCGYLSVSVRINVVAEFLELFRKSFEKNVQGAHTIKK